MIQKHVTIKDPYMRMAYEIAKALYNETKWNLKTTPVVIIVKDGKFISAGIANQGNHVLHKTCKRLGKSGTPYKECKWCVEIEHAERYAIKEAVFKGEDLKGSKIYLYGHYKICETCKAALKDKGINEVVFLENCRILFDRHHKDSLIGKPKQFEL